MANQKKKAPPRTIPQMLVDTFFGSFKRFLGTVGLVFIVFAMLFPGHAVSALDRIFGVIATALMPFVPFMVAGAFVLVGLKFILKKL